MKQSTCSIIPYISESKCAAFHYKAWLPCRAAAHTGIYCRRGKTIGSLPSGFLEREGCDSRERNSHSAHQGFPPMAKMWLLLLLIRAVWKHSQANVEPHQTCLAGMCYRLKLQISSLERCTVMPEGGECVSWRAGIKWCGNAFRTNQGPDVD